ncbi:MAG: glycosyltransferase family 2 protein [Planktotalea sp.]|uniref:glycosyltransferase family 2 protein n=1 Tax=Planktotalea sp. TaxID=2029877 RepID=UPI003C735499
MPSILTIILNYKTPEMTLQSLAAALREMAGLEGEIVIVDNDSNDGSFEMLSASAQGLPRVRVVQSGHNGGFGAGNNVGLRLGLSDGSAPDYYYVLNSDAFPDEGSIRALLDHLEANPKVGFAGSYIHGPEGDPHLTTFRFPSIWSELEGAARFGPISRALRNKRVPIDVPDQTCEVDWLAGASLMMRRKVLEDIGLFDETFFLYFEETDLCRRAKLAGWPTVFVRSSEVTHIGSVSTGMKTWARMPQYWFDSRLHYFTKNHGWLYALLAVKAHVVGGLLWRVRRLLQGKPQADPDHFLRDLIVHDTRNLLSRPRAAKVPRLGTLERVGES